MTKMSGYKKGAVSRERIIKEAREIFNEFGITITLSVLAKKMGITIGRLTYHFPTKDSIFLAIAQDYEKKRASQRIREYTGKFNLIAFYQIVSRAMDLQFEYRCAMRYIASISKDQAELSNHTTESYKLSRELILQATQMFVANGELKHSILDDKNYNVYLFIFSSLLTSWLINLEIYDHSESYKNMKPIYLNGIFSTYIPYCTEQGLEVLREIGVL